MTGDDERWADEPPSAFWVQLRRWECGTAAAASQLALATQLAVDDRLWDAVEWLETEPRFDRETGAPFVTGSCSPAQAATGTVAVGIRKGLSPGHCDYAVGMIQELGACAALRWGGKLVLDPTPQITACPLNSIPIGIWQIVKPTNACK